MEIDLDSCKGYATCIVVAPSVFDLDEETNKVILLDDHPSDTLADRLEDARRACPVSAIKVNSSSATT
ncbi:ferredoxin [Streptomyces sp. NPDC005077]|uniref:ferredoxin n=1 Tax=Streptomyces sp. NPDC005077 TaxID=3154292 RepID=UPI0033A3F21E